ncbi:hypothetical protein [Nisaea sp.]|uniref:hypothetical protein n=1 Tax=Nisaea sp. TaxID=2024842 RepID=UPI003296C21B
MDDQENRKPPSVAYTTYPRYEELPMHVRSILAVLSLLAALPACADPNAAAEIEIRRTNALAAISAVRDGYCALSPAVRARLRDAGEIDPALDSCTTPTETPLQEIRP